jgi:hypothetical protein
MEDQMSNRYWLAVLAVSALGLGAFDVRAQNNAGSICDPPYYAAERSCQSEYTSQARQACLVRASEAKSKCYIQHNSNKKWVPK